MYSGNLKDFNRIGVPISELLQLCDISFRSKIQTTEIDFLHFNHTANSLRKSVLNSTFEFYMSTI